MAEPTDRASRRQAATLELVRVLAARIVRDMLAEHQSPQKSPLLRDTRPPLNPSASGPPLADHSFGAHNALQGCVIALDVGAESRSPIRPKGSTKRHEQTSGPGRGVRGRSRD